MLLCVLPCAGLLAACDDDNTDKVWGGAACATIAPGCLERFEGCAVEGSKAACEACPVGQFPEAPNGACRAFTGTPLERAFGPYPLDPGAEIRSVCETWSLGNQSDIFVNGFELASKGGFHHNILFFVPEGYKDWPTGRWLDCYENGFTELDAALGGGVLAVSSTEVDGETQRFPDGVVVRIPPGSRVIAALHLRNGGTKAISAELKAKLHTVSKSEVESRLGPAQLVMNDLEIPTDADSEFKGQCDVAAAYQELKGKPLEMKIRGFIPHMHPAATSQQIRVVGGPEDGRLLVDLGPYEPVTLGHVFDPPVDLANATGLSMRCTYDHTLAADPSWGTGHEEKCETLVYTESDMAFAGFIGPAETTPAPGPDGVRDWPCLVVGFPYDTGAAN